jgi:PAS domain S-box-containing protein
MEDRTKNTAYQALFEHSNIGIVISNVDGVIEQANPFAVQMFGYQNQELVGNKIEILIPKKLEQKHVGYRTNYNKEPRVRAMGIGMDLWAVKKNGVEFPVEISLAAYETNGKKQIVSFVNDITERKKAEEGLKKLNTELEAKVSERTKELSQALQELGHINKSLNEEMEQRKKVEDEVRRAFEKEKDLNELKSRFVSMASHEFRTPLSGILTSAALIARYPNPQDEDKRNKHIKTIKTSVQSLTNILNDFLSLDKLDQGKIECHPTTFSVVEFVENLTAEMHEISKGGQRIQYQPES